MGGRVPRAARAASSWPSAKTLQSTKRKLRLPSGPVNSFTIHNSRSGRSQKQHARPETLAKGFRRDASQLYVCPCFPGGLVFLAAVAD